MNTPPRLPVLVISLRRAPVRREQVRGRLDALGIPFTFLDATDLRDAGTDPDFRRYDRARFMAHNPGYRKKDHLAPGEIACALSHYRAARIAAASGHPWTLILEDDAVIRTPRLDELISAATRLATGPRPVILLNSWCRGAHSPSARRLPGDARLIRPNRETMLTGGYLLSADAARAIAADIETAGIIRGIDWWIAPGLSDWSHLLSIYAVKPDPILQDAELPSMIAAAGRPGGGNLHAGTDPWFGPGAGLVWSRRKWYRLPRNLLTLLGRRLLDYRPPPRPRP